MLAETNIAGMRNAPESAIQTAIRTTLGSIEIPGILRAKAPGRYRTGIPTA
jgi:hypothetical protein